jgi:hypothetical protein
MADRDLKLNSIRYVKESPGLVLEEHGHCEVPAGCGGVILRWRERSRIPIQIWLHTGASKTVYLDGKVLDSGRPLVGPGEHVLAIHFSRIEPDDGVLMAACFYDEKRFTYVKFNPPSGRTFRLLSLADGTWKYTTEIPRDDSWMMPGYNDSRWHSMVPKDLSPPSKDDGGAIHRIKHIEGLGGQGLGIDEPASALLVRRTFILESS